MNQETIHIRKLTTGYPGKGGTKIVAKDIDATIRSGESREENGNQPA